MECECVINIVKLAYLRIKQNFTIKKMIVIIYVFIFMGEDVYSKMIDLSTETGYPMNKLEPFILTVSDKNYALLFFVLYLMIISGIPYRGKSSVYEITRIGRKKWILGELLYSYFASILLLFIIALGTIIWQNKTGFFSNTWSPLMTEMYAEYPEKYEMFNHLFIKDSVVTQGSPGKVFINSTLLLSLNFLLLSQILCVFSLVNGKKVGYLLVTFLIASGWGALEVNSPFKWYFPMAHSIYGEHFINFMREEQFSLAGSYFYFIIINIILLIVNLVCVRKLKIVNTVEGM